MNYAMAQDIKQLEQNYYDISELYDLAESLADTVDRAHVSKPEDQLALIEPLIEQISDSAEVLTEEYVGIAEGSVKANKTTQKRIQGAMRKIYSAIDAYGQKIGREAGEAINEIRNVADPIVRKIKRQMEIVIGHFMALIDLSLNMIMHHHDVEELKRRHSQIAAMIHAANQGLTPGQ
jgi:hypothetical protein